MIEITLREYPTTEHALSVAQRDALLPEAATLGLSIEPVLDAEGSYALTAGPIVGAMEIGDLSLLIEPKIGIAQLLSLACYPMGAFRSEERRFDFKESAALPDALAIALVGAARRAFARGLLTSTARALDRPPGLQGGREARRSEWCRPAAQPRSSSVNHFNCSPIRRPSIGTDTDRPRLRRGGSRNSR